MSARTTNQPTAERERSLAVWATDRDTSSSMISLIHELVFREDSKGPSPRGGEGGPNSSTAKEGDPTRGINRINTHTIDEAVLVLELLLGVIRRRSPDKLLPTELCNLWSRFKEALHDGRNLKERATDLCLWLEADSSLDKNETVSRDLDAKVLTVDGVIYDTSRCMAAANIYWHMYKNRGQAVHWGELVRLRYCRGRQDNIKKILDTLPPELRAHIKSLGRGGRIYVK